MDKNQLSKELSKIFDKMILSDSLEILNLTTKANDLIYKFADNVLLNFFEKERFERVSQAIEREIRSIIEDQMISESTILQDIVNYTEISEKVCSDFGVDFEGGPLDHPDHWIWSDVMEIGYKLSDELDNITDPICEV